MISEDMKPYNKLAPPLTEIDKLELFRMTNW